MSRTTTPSPEREKLRRTPASGKSHAPRPELNVAESPLSWLSRRLGKDGRPLVAPEQLAAGERLRRDFEFAHLRPRVTARWDQLPGTGRRGAPGCGLEIADSVSAAAERVRRALAAVGPELSGILIDVCCHLKGIEASERERSWPQRSGKIVLCLALDALARHYGLGSEPSAGTRRASMVRHWGSPGYRPTIDGEDAASDQAEGD